jgi:hypothetical protein
MGGVLALSALLLGATQASAASIEFRNAVARVVVIPEDRADIAVVILKNYDRHPLKVERWGDQVIVDGGLATGFFGNVMNCNMHGGLPMVTLFGFGTVGYDDMAQVVVRTPKDVKVTAGGAVFGFIGGTDSLDLTAAGCGDWTVGNVRGELKLMDAGSGDVHVGSVGQANLRVAGSGDVTTRAIAHGADISIGGSGDMTLEEASGPVKIRIGGSGDVVIKGGHATSLDVLVAGSGDVGYKGVADSFTGMVAGSGDVTVTKVTGPVKKSVAGSGDINVGQ